MKMLELSKNQTKILETIILKINKFGYPPSIREICAAVGLRSTSTVHFHLNKLEKLGYIKRDPTKPRAIEILEKEYYSDGLHQELIDLPVINQDIAGKPIGSEENIEEYIPMPANFIIGKDNFILKVKDKSMVNAGILEGDYVIVDKAFSQLNSNIVVAKVDEKIIIRRFSQKKNYISLEAENDFLDVILLEKSKIDIIGVVRGKFRVIK